MRFARRLSSACTVLLLAISALFLRGCLQAEESDLIRYDAQRDEFRDLMIQRGISGSDADDLHYLQAFFQNRDHLLMPVMTAGIPLLDVRLLRLTDRTFAFVSFATAPGSLDAHESPVSLNHITITPGTFYVEDHTLCYYHAITVPGKIIDGALDQISIAAQSDDMIKALNNEVTRRQQGGARQTWEAITADAMHSIDQEIAPPPPTSQPADDKSDPLACFDEDSLHRLLTAITAKSLRIHRAGPLFSVAFPLSPADAQAITAGYKKIGQHVHDLALAHTDSQTLKVQNALVDAITLTSDATGITVTVDPVHLSHRLPPPKTLTALPATDDGKKTATARIDTLKFIRDQKLPLDETLTTQKILNDFATNTLRAYPSATPVVPGAGMVKPPSPAPAP